MRNKKQDKKQLNWKKPRFGSWLQNCKFLLFNVQNQLKLIWILCDPLIRRDISRIKIISIWKNLRKLRCISLIKAGYEFCVVISEDTRDISANQSPALSAPDQWEARLRWHKWSVISVHARYHQLPYSVFPGCTRCCNWLTSSVPLISARATNDETSHITTLSAAVCSASQIIS